MVSKTFPGPLARPQPLEKNELQSSGPLYELFLAQGLGTVHKWHHYFDAYERHFSRFRGAPLRFLEIGVARGGSQALWRSYFGEEALLVGIDIDPACAALDGKHGVVRIGDQTDSDFLAEIEAEFGPFDIVLDDGGHTALQQITSFAALYPGMSPTGVYLCEDTHTALWEDFRDHPEGDDFLELTSRIALGLNAAHEAPSSFGRFFEQPSHRKGDVSLPLVTATTLSVTFYDSIVVFERAPKSEPWHEIR